MSSTTAHQLARRRRRRAVAVISQDELYGVRIRSRGHSFELIWRPSTDPLVALAQVHGLDHQVEALVANLIWACRRSGLSWEDVAGMLGYSRAAVQKRYGHLVADIESQAS